MVGDDRRDARPHRGSAEVQHLAEQRRVEFGEGSVANVGDRGIAAQPHQIEDEGGRGHRRRIDGLAHGDAAQVGAQRGGGERQPLDDQPRIDADPGERRAAAHACLAQPVGIGGAMARRPVKARCRHDILAAFEQPDDITDERVVGQRDARRVDHHVGVEREDVVDARGGHDAGRRAFAQFAGVTPGFGRVVDEHAAQGEVGVVDDPA